MKRGGLLALGVNRPVGMLMVFCATTVFGLVSLGKLPFNLMPDLDYPTLRVRSEWPGAAPEDIEQRVIERLEDNLSTVGGLVRMGSTSRAGMGEVRLEFAWGSNLPFLVQEVRERLDRVFLPAGAERPLILRYDPSLDPVMRLALAGDSDLVRLRDLAELEIERELEGITGVAAVQVRGGLEDEIQIRLDPQLLVAAQLTPEFVRTRLQEENINVPGGNLREGEVEYVVRTLNEFRTLEEIENLPMVRRGQSTLRLSDLGQVERTAKDRDVILRVAGQEAVEIAIYREAGANLTAVAAAVRKRLFEAEAKPTGSREMDQSQGKNKQTRRPPLVEKLPAGIHLSVLSDQSLFVEDAIGEVIRAAILGGLLAILVCYLFLGQATLTWIIGLAIPVSMVASFGAMFTTGVSLNVMSLGGLALAVGMLVDNAIVVLESMGRCRDEGDPPLEAALRGVREVGSAVTASTLTTIAVFAPILFVEGVAGRVFGDQSLTVVAALMLSLAVALLFIPGLAARLIPSPQEDRRANAPHRLFARLRSGPFRGLRKPNRRAWILGLLFLFLALAAQTRAGMLAAPWQEQWNDQAWRVPDEIKDSVRIWGAWGTLLFVPFLLGPGRPLLQALGRLVADCVGAVGALCRLILGVCGFLAGLVLRPMAALTGRFLRAADRHYPVFLTRSIRHPAPILGTTTLLALASFLAASSLGTELLPEVRQGELTALLHFPPGTPLDKTDRLAAALERRLAQLPHTQGTASLVGSPREEIGEEGDGPNVARLLLKTPPLTEMPHAEEELEGILRDILAAEPALNRFEIRKPALFSLEAPLEIEILGQDLEQGSRLAEEIAPQLAGVSGIVDLRSSHRRGHPELQITLDRDRLAQHGLDLAQVATRLRLAVEGEVVTTFPEEDERLDIRIRANLGQGSRVAMLRSFPVNSDAEHPLPLEAVADIRVAFGPSEIRHIGSQRVVVLAAALEGGLVDLGGASAATEAVLARTPVPAGTTLRLGGRKQEMEAALDSLGFALALALFLVFAVMAAQFESFVQPLIVMATVPLAGIGVVWALKWTDTPISVVAMLGTVILAGIVVNNAIVLVHYINSHRKAGMALEKAVVEAGRARLRPIVMTSCTTILGMLPMTGWFANVPGLAILGGAQGAELRAPMALVVIAGLLVSTILTLIVIPTFYATVAGARRQART